MMKSRRIISILSIFVSLIMAIQPQAVAFEVVRVSIPINIAVTRVTTHLDYYSVPAGRRIFSPLVCDLDGDHALEIVGAGYNLSTLRSSIYVWGRNGAARSGWPIEINGEVTGSPAVGDMDGDGDLEIVVSTAGPNRIYAWHYDGRLVSGYPRDLSFRPGLPVAGDVTGDFSEEALVYSVDAALCDIDQDGKMEIIRADAVRVVVENGDGTPVAGWPKGLVDAIDAGVPVIGDVDNNGSPEIFLAVKRLDGNFIYGWRSDGTSLTGWPINIAGVVNAPGNFMSIADLNGDGICEIISGSTNGYIAAWRLNGTVLFSSRPGSDAIYQPIIGDIDNDRDMEILATSRSGNIYCYDHLGNPVSGWPRVIGSELSPGIVLADIDSGVPPDALNPVNDLELLFGANDGQIHCIDLPGDFRPEDVQWGMYRFSNRGTGNWLRGNRTKWSVFDDIPSGARVNTVYDWNKGSRVTEFVGRGLDNSYAFLNPDRGYINTRNTRLQWSMRYSMDFSILVSIDTVNGRRFLNYTPTVGDMLAGVHPSGRFIHHGLDDIRDGRWHTFSRSLVSDLKAAEPLNEIIDINGVYVQGNGRIDDVMFLAGEPAIDVANFALTAEVRVTSGEATKDNINDGNTGTLWTSAVELNPRVEYVWDTPLDMINKITIENVSGASGGTMLITHSDGTVEAVPFTIDRGTIEILFDARRDVRGITLVFNSTGGSVSVGEIGVYSISRLSGSYTIDNYIQIRDGYFWNPQLNDRRGGYWIPHGISYQTWNRLTGQWQSPSQLRRDLNGIANAGANAIKVDFLWRYFDLTNYDILLEEARSRGLKVFPVINFQPPPDSALLAWYTMHPPDERHPAGPWRSSILSYEHPDAQRQFIEFLQTVVRRYSVGGVREDLSNVVAGWILGNEYGYLNQRTGEYEGYDLESLSRFREWLEISVYRGDIGELNRRWAGDNVAVPGYLPGHPYTRFSDVDMPIPVGSDGRYLGRDKASWYDLIQWREKSIADFVAMAADAVRAVDLHHLISCTANEDAKKIVQACRLDFWCIENNNERWGIEKARHDTGLPIMVTETGFTSTDGIINEARQALLVRNAIWEALESGAIGVCVFHWNDRDGPILTASERGFGIVRSDGSQKPAYNAVQDTFRKIDEINLRELLPQFREPQKDIAFLRDDAVDSIGNRYEVEMSQLFRTLERLGFNPTFIDRDGMLRRDYLDYEAIVLPRNQKMFEDVLTLLPAAGVKIHANSDLPGIMDEYGRPRNRDSDWLLMMQDLFGIDTTLSNLNIDPNLEDSDYNYGYYETSSVVLNFRAKQIYAPILGYDTVLNLWKYRDRIVAGRGTVLARFDGPTGSPALIINNDSAISLFSLGDNNMTLQDRYNWVRLIYMDRDYGFGLDPSLQITGSPMVLVDYRITPDNSRMLLSFKNYSSSTSETIHVTNTDLNGKVVRDMLSAAVVEDPSDGTVTQTLPPDGHSLLLASPSTSRVSTDPVTPPSTTPSTPPPASTTTSAPAQPTASVSTSVSTPAQSSTSATSLPTSTTTSNSTTASNNSTTGTTGISSGNTVSNNSDDEEDDNESSNFIPGVGSVIILEREGKKKKEDETRKGETESGTAKTAGDSRYSHYRTYIGNGKATSTPEPMPQLEVSAPEIPPLEQFSQNINEAEYQMPGIINVTPKILTMEQVKEIIRPAPKQQSKFTSQEIPVWVEKITRWVNNLSTNLRNIWKSPKELVV